MPNTGDEYSSTPGNAIGATEYPSTMLAQADQLQGIQDKLLKKRKVVDAKKFRLPVIAPEPYSATGAVMLKSESFTRHPLNSKKSRYRTLNNRVKEVRI